MLFDKFWRLINNVNWYNGILKRKHIYKKPDNNNFHYMDELFYVVIEAMVVILYMYIVGYSTIHEFQT